MKKQKSKSRTANRFLFFVGIFFTAVGFAAMIVFLTRDVFGMAVPIRGNMIPLSLLTVMGAGLLWGSYRETDE